MFIISWSPRYNCLLNAEYTAPTVFSQSQGRLRHRVRLLSNKGTATPRPSGYGICPLMCVVDSNLKMYPKCRQNVLCQYEFNIITKWTKYINMILLRSLYNFYIRIYHAIIYSYIIGHRYYYYEYSPRLSADESTVILLVKWA